MSWDPLNTAMDLFGELQELARREREVDESYLQMAETCETFAMELLMVIIIIIITLYPPDSRRNIYNYNNSV